MPDDCCSASQRALEYELSLGRKFQMLSFYAAWGPRNGRPDRAGIEEVVRKGFVPMITWEPWHLPAGARPEYQPDFSLASIMSGRYDEYIRHWAVDLKEIEGPIFFRPMHEMNGNWYPWCGSVNGNTPEKFVEAWRYMRSIFRKAGSDRLEWVWSPYALSVPDAPHNNVGRYYPGADEVDWVGLDGYNWGTSQAWSRWQSFEEIFGDAYEQVSRVAPDKPCMIAEAGCAEDGGNKGRWIEEAFEALSSRFTRIKVLVWFNIDKECDWRIESSQESLAAFRACASQRRSRRAPD